MATSIFPQTFTRRILMLPGGTTALNEKGDYYEGDMSGIQAKNIPRWFRRFYKPGGNISKKPNWGSNVSNWSSVKAPQWDVGTVCGVPAWVQIVLAEIIKYHGVKNIHEIWPNLAVYIHGGVSFEPYRDSFQKLLGKPINFIETIYGLWRVLRLCRQDQEWRALNWYWIPVSSMSPFRSTKKTLRLTAK